MPGPRFPVHTNGGGGACFLVHIFQFSPSCFSVHGYGTAEVVFLCMVPGCLQGSARTRFSVQFAIYAVSVVVVFWCGLRFIPISGSHFVFRFRFLFRFGCVFRCDLRTNPSAAAPPVSTALFCQRRQNAPIRRRPADLRLWRFFVAATTEDGDGSGPPVRFIVQFSRYFVFVYL